MRNLKGENVKVVEKFYIFVIVALVVILAGVGFMIARGGMNIGLDFSGGVKIEVNFDNMDSESEKIVTSEIEKVVKDNGYNMVDAVQVSGTVFEARLDYTYNGEKISSDKETDFITGVQGDGENTGLKGKLSDALTELCENNETLKNNNVTLAEENGVTAYSVGATASSTLLRSAIIALCVAIVCMLIYIVIRFTFASAIAAVCALCHDVLIMVALTAIFNVPVNSTFIAAVITIVGYSINATIIIFDRIREDMKNPNLADLTDAELANGAIAKTLGRTILTTITTLVMVVALAVLSVSAIQDFILPIIFGLIAGAFSSVLLAPAVWTMLRKTEKKIKAKRDAKKGYQGAKKATE